MWKVHCTHIKHRLTKARSVWWVPEIRGERSTITNSPVEGQVVYPFIPLFTTGFYTSIPGGWPWDFQPSTVCFSRPPMDGHPWWSRSLWMIYSVQHRETSLNKKLYNWNKNDPTKDGRKGGETMKLQFNPLEKYTQHAFFWSFPQGFGGVNMQKISCKSTTKDWRSPSGPTPQWDSPPVARFFFRGIFTSRLPLVLIHSHLRYPRRVGWISQHAKRPFWKTFQVESYRYWDKIYATLLATYGKKITNKYEAQTNHATCSVYGCFQK